RQVLQHQVGVDQVEGVVREGGQVGGLVQVERDAPPAPVQPAGLCQHGGGDVDPVDRLEVPGQRVGEPAGAAAEVQGAAGAVPDAQLGEAGEGPVDLRGAGGEELLVVPAAVALVRVDADRPQRLGRSQPGPVPADLVQAHRAHSLLRRLVDQVLIYLRLPSGIALIPAMINGEGYGTCCIVTLSYAVTSTGRPPGRGRERHARIR